MRFSGGSGYEMEARACKNEMRAKAACKARIMRLCGFAPTATVANTGYVFHAAGFRGQMTSSVLAILNA